MQTIDADWIRARLDGVRGEQAKLADAMGITPAKMSLILSGKRQIQNDELPRLLAFFGETGFTSVVPVLSYVGAGAEVYAIDDNEKGDGSFDPVPAPPGAGPSAVGVIVRGDSMWPAYKDGDVLIFDKRLPAEELVGKECIIELEDGRTLVKTIKRGASDSFTLMSHNAPDIEDVYIRWAARVAFVYKA